MKHLFLEGPKQTGKSTLIRETLKPFMDSASAFNCSDNGAGLSLGGFACQRLVSGNVTKAFRIGPAGSTPLTASLEDFFSAIGAEAFAQGTGAASLPGHEGVFKAFADGGLADYAENTTIIDNDVFASDGAGYLRDTNRRNLMLLDEIGGQELKSPVFMDALYELLSGDIPCLGVLKRAEDAARIDPELARLNLRLRERILEDFDGRILYYERGDESVRKTLEDFLLTVSLPAGAPSSVELT